jgi:peptidyl-prolyl cis-trans isomerase C
MPPPVFAYHLLRCAVEKYQKPINELDQKQYDDVNKRAEKSYALESLVLSSPEARDIIIPDEDVNRAVDEIALRYEDNDSFLEDMKRNQLDREILRQALQRELVFNAVMEMVARNSVRSSDLDIRVFYELHRDRFTSPEARVARHILVTINDEYQENTREEAMARISKIAAKVSNNPNRFSSQAKKYSECPTALEGGSLGTVKRGTLYPELDVELFSMKPGEVSDVIESEIGFHIIYCEKIHKAKVIPLSRVYEKIRASLDDRKRRTCQKAWIKQLQEGEKL